MVWGEEAAQYPTNNENGEAFHSKIDWNNKITYFGLIFFGVVIVVVVVRIFPTFWSTENNLSSKKTRQFHMLRINPWTTQIRCFQGKSRKALSKSNLSMRNKVITFDIFRNINKMQNYVRLKRICHWSLIIINGKQFNTCVSVVLQ